MGKGSTSSSLLRRHADAISQTFSQCDRACFDVGACLGEAIPGLNDLAGLFTTLSEMLESAEFRRAGTDLQEVSQDIKAIGRDLVQESKALVDLVDLNKHVGRLIEDLAGSVRVIAALVFNVKIEAALTNDEETNMVAFADDLKGLSSKAVSALEDYQQTHSKLFELLQKSCGEHIKFEEEYQAKLLEIAAGIVESLETVGTRRHEISKNLAEIGRQSQNIGMQVGQAVMALQVGDSTRQRIEHAQQGLYLAASIDDGSAVLDGQVLSVDEPLCSSVVAQICRLQSQQINAALDQFLREIIVVDRLLRNLMNDADGLALRGQSLFGSGSERSDSFVEELKKKLEVAHMMIEECRKARASVDSATRAVDMTMADLSLRTAGLSNIITDITMIGMNTMLKSSRLGQRGKCLTVIAQELQSYATKVVRGIRDLPPALQKVTAIVERLAEVNKAHDAEHMLTISNIMAAAIESFNESGVQMSDALTKLNAETGAISATLDDAVRRVGVSDDIQKTLKATLDSIDAMATSFTDQVVNDLADQILQSLRAAYTMASERQIHDRFIGVTASPKMLDGQDHTQSATSGASDLMEACLF